MKIKKRILKSLQKKKYAYFNKNTPLISKQNHSLLVTKSRTIRDIIIFNCK